MGSHQKINVSIESNRSNKSSGSVEVENWDKKERTMRGLKALAICWGTGIVCVIFPIIHFVVVPVCLLAGPAIFFWIAGQENVILGGKGECPECHKEFDIARSSVKWPLTDICNHCQAELKMIQA